MQRGRSIVLVGILIILIGFIGGIAAIGIYENSLIEYELDEFSPITLSPNESRSVEFEFSEEGEVYFYFDYYTRTPLKIVITDSEGDVKVDKNINNPLLDSPFKSTPGIYLLEITNVGNRDIDLYDFGYQKPPLSRDENGNFVPPSGSWYSNILENLVFVGFVVLIIGGIIFWKDKRKIQKNQ